MKSLNYAFKNSKMAFMLYLPDLFIFLVVFVPVLVFLRATTSGNYYSIHFTVDYIADILPQTRGLSAYGVVFLFFLIVYLLTRLYILTGVFSKIAGKGGKCFKPDKKDFLRFLNLFLFYGVIFLLVFALINLPFKKLIENTVNLKHAYILGNIKDLLLYIFTLVIALFHTVARVKTIKQSKLSFFSKPENIIPFFLYQVAGFLIAVCGFIIALKLAFFHNYLLLILSFVIFQIALFLKIVFFIASYRAVA